MAEPFNSLGLENIIRLNREAIAEFGGFSAQESNMLNPASLEFILEAILFPVFGEDLYPSVTDKIAAIVHTIILRHVFRDGNKRTALAVIQALARENSLKFAPDKIAEDYMVHIAENSLGIAEISKWLRIHLKPVI